MSLFGIDVGSGSCKGVVFAADGAILAQAARAYAPHCPRPAWAEMPAETFWEAFVAVTREVAALVPRGSRSSRWPSAATAKPSFRWSKTAKQSARPS